MAGSHFIPEFGPNGAVMNSPSMTPEMRAKFEAPGGLTRDGRNFILLIFGIQLLLSLAQPVHAFLTTSPWWSGVLTGAVGIIALRALWQFTLRTLARWELCGQTRLLRMPGWSRVALAASDIAMGACMAAMLVGQVADLAGEYLVPRILIVAGLVVFGIVGWFLRWLGDALKWSWRQPRTADVNSPLR